MDVQEYIRSECDRQHVTNYDDFQAALEYSTTVSRWFPMVPFGTFVQRIAQLVEPSVNAFYHNGATFTNLRRSEVGFLHGGNAAKAIDVPARFERWVYMCDMELVGSEEELIEALLDIHPWADGNGRTASILRNWVYGKLDDPEPLPYYYGGQ